MCDCEQLVRVALAAEPLCYAFWAYRHTNNSIIVKRWSSGHIAICDRCYEERYLPHTHNRGFVEQVSDLIIATDIAHAREIAEKQLLPAVPARPALDLFEDLTDGLQIEPRWAGIDLD